MIATWDSTCEKNNAHSLAAPTQNNFSNLGLDCFPTHNLNSRFGYKFSFSTAVVRVDIRLCDVNLEKCVKLFVKYL